MICHKHKCIFIHIPRTAGSSIETSISKIGWVRHLDQKHMLASNAKELYKDYWNDYFKFSIVRNPWDRMVSMTQYTPFYGPYIRNGLLNVDEYRKKWPRVELDPRSYTSKVTRHPTPDAVYLNILNEPLDYIMRFETLEQDYNTLCHIIDCKNDLIHVEKNSKVDKHYTEYYDEPTKNKISQWYKKDITTFDYKFEV